MPGSPALRHLGRAARWVLPPVLLLGFAALPRVADADASLGELHATTVRFHSVEQANRAGYFDNPLPCFDEGSNGMGEHLVNDQLLGDGGALDASHPEALVYEVRPQGGWKLVAVEFIVLFDDAPPDGPAPELFGQPFTQHSSLPLWKLHAWVHRDNPLGMFTDYSPDVATCPGSSVP